jgi:hypothetical protein
LAGTEDGKQTVMLDIRQLVPLFLMNYKFGEQSFLKFKLGDAWVKGRALYELYTRVEGDVDAFANGVEETVSEFHDRRKQTMVDIECGSYGWHIELGFRLVS